MSFYIAIHVGSTCTWTHLYYIASATFITWHKLLINQWCDSENISRYATHFLSSYMQYYNRPCGKSVSTSPLKIIMTEAVSFIYLPCVCTQCVKFRLTATAGLEIKSIDITLHVKLKLQCKAIICTVLRPSFCLYSLVVPEVSGLYHYARKVTNYNTTSVNSISIEHLQGLLY